MPQRLFRCLKGLSEVRREFRPKRIQDNHLRFSCSIPCPSIRTKRNTVAGLPPCESIPQGLPRNSCRFSLLDWLCWQDSRLFVEIADTYRLVEVDVFARWAIRMRSLDTPSTVIYPHKAFFVGYFVHNIVLSP